MSESPTPHAKEAVKCETGSTETTKTGNTACT